MRPYLLLCLAAALLLTPFLGSVHLFDWDEINFAEAAREMVVRGNYNEVTINYMPFWEKPPLFFWMQAAGYHVFGVGEFAARFPNILCALATLCTLMALGRRLHGEAFGWLWPLVYLGSFLPQFYLRSGLIDPWFNLFIFWGLLGLIWHAEQRRNGCSGLGPMALGGIAAGLAVLTKGPAALLLIGLCGAVYWVAQRFYLYFSLAGLFLFALCAVAVPGLWFGVETLRHGPALFEQFLAYQVRLAQTEDAGHGGFPGYHVVVLLFGCFPASFLFIQSFFIKKNTAIQAPTSHLPPPASDFWRWMQILFWVVLVVFSLVQSKIVHYSSLCYLPLTYGAARAAIAVYEGRMHLPGWIKGGWIFIGIVLGVVCMAFPYLATHIDLIRPYLAADPFAQANLDALPGLHWSGLEALVGLWALGVPCLAVALYNRGRARQGMQMLFGGTAITVMLVLWAFMGRIEAMSQGAAIEYLQSLQGKRAYIVPQGYRTYATIFYARLRPEQAPGKAYEDFTLMPDRWRDSILTQPIDRPVYVVSKITKSDEWKHYPLLKETGRKNGFVFLRKE